MIKKKHITVALLVTMAFIAFSIIYLKWGTQAPAVSNTWRIDANGNKVLLSSESSNPKAGEQKDLPKGGQDDSVSQHMRRAFIRDIDIAGQVVDENGAPIKNVSLLACAHLPKVGSKNTRKTLKDGKFSFKLSDCLALDLYFTKPGYFEKKIVFSPHSPNNPNPPKWIEELEDDKLVIREKALQVKLDHVGGGWNYMDKYRISCEFSTTGKWKGTVLSRNPEYSAANRKKSSAKPFITKKVEFSPDEVPENCIYFTAPLDKRSMKIKTVNAPVHLVDESFSYLPGESAERISLLGTGLILFQQANTTWIDLARQSGEWDTLMMRQLKSAPLKDYASKVDVIPSSRMAKRFFYVKVFDQYGRLSIVPPSLTYDTLQRMKVDFYLYLQPDGSQDVRSMEGVIDALPKKSDNEARPGKTVIPEGEYAFQLSGRVVDQQGNQIRDYKVMANPRKGMRSIERLRFNDEFALSYTASNLSIDVSKDGYYSRAIHLIGEEPDSLKSIGATRKERRIEASSIKITLEKTGPLTPLSVTTLMPGDINYKVGSDPSGLFLMWKGGVLRAEPEYFKLSPTSLPKVPVMYLRATEGNGKLKLPLDIKFGIGGEGNGIILYDPKDNEADSRIVFRELKEAPLEGYQDEVAIDSKKKRTFFYFKFENLYGKGALTTPPRVSENGKELLVGMILYFQPNKTRNVRTK